VPPHYLARGFSCPAPAGLFFCPSEFRSTRAGTPPSHEHFLTEQLVNLLLTFAVEVTKSNRHSDKHFGITEVSLEAMSWVAWGIFALVMLGIAALAIWLVYEISTP